MPVMGVSLRSTQPAAPPRTRAASGARSLRVMGRVMDSVGVIWGLEAEAPTDENRAIRRHTGAGLTLWVEHRRAGVGEQPRILRREVDAHGLRAHALDQALRDLRAERDGADPQERAVLGAARLEA